MKKNATVFHIPGRPVLFASLALLLFVVMSFSASVSAASYPLIVPKKFTQTVTAGDTVEIEYSYFPSYKNERIDTYLYNSSGTLIATASKSFYNSSIAMKTYTVTYDTAKKPAGEYKVVSRKFFYSLYKWNEAPTTTTSYFTIECSHDWTEWQHTFEPTCVDEGLYTRYCTICLAGDKQNPPPTGIHEWDEGKVTKEATCSKDGVMTFSCKNCDETKTEPIPATGKHTWDEGKVTREASCFEEGEKTFTCSVCGETKKETVAAIGAHTWDDGKVTKEATCSEDGVKTFACTVCKETRTEAIPATGIHTWDDGAVTKAATASAEGEKTFTCTVCHETRTESIPKVQEQAAPSSQNVVAPLSPEEAPAVKEEEKAIVNITGNGDSKKSSFGVLRAYSKKITNTSVTLAWTKVKGANGYIIYGNKCGKKNKYLKIATIKKASVTSKKITKINKTKLKKGTYYKFIVVATAKDSSGTQKVIATSKSVHFITTGNKKFGDFTKVRLDNVKKNKLKLAVGKTFTIKATQVKPKKLKVHQHRKLAFESSDKSVATVTSAGVVTAKKKGKAYIYVYAQNGIYQKITVTVK